MKTKNKKDSIKYWDEHARDWEKMAYDKEKKYLKFPTSQQRQDITINEIEKLASTKKVSIVDLGCANGELVRTLLKKGFINVKGIDNSKKMTEVAKKILKKEIPHIDPNKIFFVDDVNYLNKNEIFDFVTAMGLIEYLINIDAFFKKLYHLLNRGGYAFIESRNKLFNLFSANKYTYKSPTRELVEELEDIKVFSPIKDEKEIEDIIIKTFISIGKNLENIKLSKEDKRIEKFDRFPFELPQATPKEIEILCKKHNLKLRYVVYYHPHPFLPKFENNFPTIFNRISLPMQPLGYTPLGATICSAFIAIIQKP